MSAEDFHDKVINEVAPVTREAWDSLSGPLCLSCECSLDDMSNGCVSCAAEKVRRYEIKRSDVYLHRSRLSLEKIEEYQTKLTAANKRIAELEEELATCNLARGIEAAIRAEKGE